MQCRRCTPGGQQAADRSRSGQAYISEVSTSIGRAAAVVGQKLPKPHAVNQSITRFAGRKEVEGQPKEEVETSRMHVMLHSISCAACADLDRPVGTVKNSK
jgi:type II secretory pathway component PulM